MISLEKVKLLESKVSRMIEYARKVSEENTKLKEKLESYEKRTRELEVLFQRFKEDQTRIEDGILSALDLLNQFEDAVESKLSSESRLSTENKLSPEGKLSSESKLSEETKHRKPESSPAALPAEALEDSDPESVDSPPEAEGSELSVEVPDEELEDNSGEFSGEEKKFDPALSAAELDIF